MWTNDTMEFFFSFIVIIIKPVKLDVLLRVNRSCLAGIEPRERLVTNRALYHSSYFESIV